MENVIPPGEVAGIIAAVLVEPDFIKKAKEIIDETKSGKREKLSKQDMDGLLAEFSVRESIGTMRGYLEKIPPHARPHDPVRKTMGEYCAAAYALIESQGLLSEYFPNMSPANS